MDPGSVIPDLIRDRGDGLLKEPGFVRPFAVIPAHAPALVAARGRSHRGAKDCPRGSGLRHQPSGPR
jgi:hypothetical protein